MHECSDTVVGPPQSLPLTLRFPSLNILRLFLSSALHWSHPSQVSCGKPTPGGILYWLGLLIADERNQLRCKLQQTRTMLRGDGWCRVLLGRLSGQTQEGMERDRAHPSSWPWNGLFQASCSSFSTYVLLLSSQPH